MSTPWITHVKAYAKNNNVTYRDALKLSKSSYQSKSGGDIKSAIRKTKNTINKGSKMVRKTAKRQTCGSISIH